MCMWQGPRPRFGTAKSSWEQGQTLDLEDSEPLGQNQAGPRVPQLSRASHPGSPDLLPSPELGDE